MARNTKGFIRQWQALFYSRSAQRSVRVVGVKNIAEALNISVRRLQQLKDPTRPDYDARVRRGIVKQRDMSSGRIVLVSNMKYLAALLGDRDREYSEAQRRNASRPRPSRRKEPQ